MSLRKEIRVILKKVRIFFLLRLKYQPIAVGRHFYCGYGNIIKKRSLQIGNWVYIGNHCHLSIDHLEIEDYVMLASQVSIVGGDHRYDIVGVPIRNTGRSERVGVKIGKDCWIGHGVIILDGVEIGEGSVIAAGSVVTKSLEPYGIYAGLPAKKIRNRFANPSDNIIHSKSINGIYSINEADHPII